MVESIDAQRDRGCARGRLYERSGPDDGTACFEFECSRHGFTHRDSFARPDRDDCSDCHSGALFHGPEAIDPAHDDLQ
jgi:hypothetical protein